MRAFILSTVLGMSVLTKATAVTKDARCAVNGNGASCLNGKWGNCCSEHGWCGSTNAYCGSGCQPEFGTCSDAYSFPIEPSTSSTKRCSTSSSIATYNKPTPTHSFYTSSSSKSPSSTQAVSTNTRCGKNFGGQTCKGSQWGDCCSNYDYCGRTDIYCQPDLCQKGYGDCDSISSSSDTASFHVVSIPTSTLASEATW